MKAFPLLALSLVNCTEQASLPVPEVSQPGAGDVIARSFGANHVMFELAASVDASRIDPARTRLVTVRPRGTELEVVEAAGEVTVDGQTLAIELADAPRASDVYRAVTVIGDRELDLGDVAFRAPPATGGVQLDTLFVQSATGGAIDPNLPPPSTLQTSTTFPDAGAVEVDRNIPRITVRYTGGVLDCANPITGIEGFHLYSIEPGLSASKQQNMYPNMPVGSGTSPGLVCDQARNALSLTVPGWLLGGALFRVDARARATDGTTLATTFTFRTKAPGLQILMPRATNEIYACDTQYPFNSSYRCDLYMIGIVKTKAGGAWQYNTKFPTETNDWSNWAEDVTKTFSPTPALYRDVAAVGDTVAVEVHAYDADSTDAWKSGLAAIGGAGKLAVSWIPPASTSEGQTQASSALPVGGDDFEGGGIYYLSKVGRWGTITRDHSFALPGRPVSSQVVIKFTVEEYPYPWYAPQIVL